MSTEEPTLEERRREVLSILNSHGWGIGALGCFIVWCASDAWDGYWLNLPGDSFTMLARLALNLFLMASMLIMLANGLGRAIRFRTWKQRHLIWVIFLIAVYNVPFGSPFDWGMKRRLSSISEHAYLEFARDVRTNLGDGRAYVRLHDGVGSSLNGFESPEASAARSKLFEAILERSAFADWRRDLIQVSVLDGSVWLWRGSGVMGSIGVEIYDLKPAPPLPSALELAENPYLHRRVPITERVSMFTSS